MHRRGVSITTVAALLRHVHLLVKSDHFLLGRSVGLELILALSLELLPARFKGCAIEFTTENSAEAKPTGPQGEIVCPAKDSQFAGIGSLLLFGNFFLTCSRLGSGRVLKDFSGWCSGQSGLGRLWGLCGRHRPFAALVAVDGAVGHG